MRLQKYLSQSGLCSRRKAEEWIEAGRVAVNGVTAKLGDGAEEDDVVTVDGRIVEPVAAHSYILLHKPRGFVTTLSDDRGRRTVAELVEDCGTRVFPVGRLDYDSEGLLILTDDGELANRLMHPSHGVTKVYRVTVEGEDIPAAAERLRRPILEGDTLLRADRVRLLSEGEGRALLEMTLSEGKNREIRRMCAAVGLSVLRLVRIEQGGVKLGGLESGKWRPLTEKEIDILHHFS